MSVPDPDQLSERVRLVRLPPHEEAELQAYLLAHPEQQATWEEDLGLNRLLRQLPDAPVSSNFAAQVMQAVRDEQRAQRIRPSSRLPVWQWLTAGGWLPRVAALGCVVTASLIAFHEHQLAARRELARDMAKLLTTAPSLEVLQNFEAIERLNQVPRDSDRDLIAALK
jgi:anti-sigma factor RsiW